jgi:predicted dehydrogenase
VSHPSDARRLRAGIVGGGEGAFIGPVHRIAAELDAEASVVAGALSSDPTRQRASAARWRLERSYETYTEMASAEAVRADGIDFVIITTPNHLHLPVAHAFLAAGIHVICDKPLTATLEDARTLAAEVRKGEALFALTHAYTGYPCVLEARALVRSGALGSIRKVMVEYLQDWLMDALEATGQRQASWRVDPARSGISCCVADIGTHGENLLEFVTGLRIEAVCADLTSFVPGRRLEDDASILLRLERGAKGTLVCSQVACGEENNLSLRVYGSKASLEWRQEEPNTLLLKSAGGPVERLRTGRGLSSEAARHATRLPPGHPEGYLEAFANVYRAFAADVRRRARGEPALGGYPTVEDGLRGLEFVSRVVESASQGSRWVAL